MRRYLRWFAAGLAFCVGGAIAANLPFLTPQTAGNDFLPAINQLINQLNGGPGYTGTPQIISPGPFCTVSGGVCNGQHGTITSGTLTAAAGGVQGVSINNSFLTPASRCYVSLLFYSGTLSTNGLPTVGEIQPGAGVLGVQMYNAHSTNALNGTVSLYFTCF